MAEVSKTILWWCTLQQLHTKDFKQGLTSFGSLYLGPYVFSMSVYMYFLVFVCMIMGAPQDVFQGRAMTGSEGRKS